MCPFYRKLLEDVFHPKDTVNQKRGKYGDPGNKGSNTKTRKKDFRNSNKEKSYKNSCISGRVKDDSKLQEEYFQEKIESKRLPDAHRFTKRRFYTSSGEAGVKEIIGL